VVTVSKGVGKSTVAANIAVSLPKQGYKTVLVDADLYGPSIPVMFGVQNESPSAGLKAGKEVLIPIEKYGVKFISIGFFIQPGQSLIWRGPMASNGLSQLFRGTDWEKTDYMIIDFPPGTGDIHLPTVKKINITGYIIVTTPQELAISDARKAASMFTDKNINVSILGIVENMSWFTPKRHPGEKYFIFGQGGGEKLAREFGTKLLGKIPLIMEVGETSDKGVHIYNQTDKTIIDAFDNIVKQLTETKPVEI